MFNYLFLNDKEFESLDCLDMDEAYNDSKHLMEKKAAIPKEKKMKSLGICLGASTVSLVIVSESSKEKNDESMSHNTVEMADWKISESEELNMPTPDEWRDKLGLEKDEMLSIRRRAKLDFLKIINQLENKSDIKKSKKKNLLHGKIIIKHGHANNFHKNNLPKVKVL